MSAMSKGIESSDIVKRFAQYVSSGQWKQFQELLDGTDNPEVVWMSLPLWLVIAIKALSTDRRQLDQPLGGVRPEDRDAVKEALSYIENLPPEKKADMLTKDPPQERDLSEFCDPITGASCRQYFDLMEKEPMLSLCFMSGKKILMRSTNKVDDYVQLMSWLVRQIASTLTAVRPIGGALSEERRRALMGAAEKLLKDVAELKALCRIAGSVREESPQT